jgi:hypothetical protein
MLRPNELVLARNSHYLGDPSVLAKVGGRSLLGSLGAKCEGLAFVRFRNGNAFLVAATATTYKSTPLPGTGEWTERATGLTPGGRMVAAYHQATDRLYVGDGVNALRAWSGSGNMRTVAISQPSAPTTAFVNNAATLYPIGSTFQYCLTAYNSTYDSQSPPSEVVVVSATTANGTWRINLPSIPSGADKWRIWKTQSGGNIFYLLAEVDSALVRYYDGDDSEALGSGQDNTTTWGFNYVEDQFLSTQDVLPMVGEPLLSNYITVNGTIPIGSIIGVFQDRLWIAGNPTYPHDIYFSGANKPEQFSPVNFFQLGNELGEHVTAAGIANDKWVGFTPNTHWRLNVFPDVTDPGFALGQASLELVSKEIGCIAPWSVRNFGLGQPNSRLFFVSARGPCATDSYVVIPLDQDLNWGANLVNLSAVARSVAVSYPKYSQIRLHVPSPRSSMNDIALIYHYHPLATKESTGVGAWLLPVHVRCSAAALTYESGIEPRMYVADTDDTGNVYAEDSGEIDHQHYDSDDGAIDWEWMSGDNALGEESQNKRVQRIFLNVTGAGDFAPELLVSVNKADAEHVIPLKNETVNAPGGLKLGTSIVERDKTRTFVGGVWQTAGHYRFRMREKAIGARGIGTIEPEIETYGRRR